MREALLILAVQAGSVNEFAGGRVKLPNNEAPGDFQGEGASTMAGMTTHNHGGGDGHGHADCLPGNAKTQGHGHSHGAGHAGHEHPPMHPSVLGWAMVATLGLVVAEIFGGWIGHSIALVNDAVHNLSDVPALGISWLAMRWAQRPADDEKTYGYSRAGELAAFTNAVLLVVLALWLGWESIGRLRAPVEVVESWMIWTSVAALAVNGGITLALVRGRSDLNLNSLLVHNFGDALSNIAIIAGAVVIGRTGWHWLDPVLGLAIGVLVLWSSLGILRASAHVLLEGRPKEMGVEEVARTILKVEGVTEVHDVHIWSLGGGTIALSCHARVPDMHMDSCEEILRAIKKLVAQEFSIGHVTVQLERAGLPAQSGYVMPAPAKQDR